LRQGRGRPWSLRTHWIGVLLLAGAGAGAVFASPEGARTVVGAVATSFVGSWLLYLSVRSAIGAALYDADVPATLERLIAETSKRR